MREVRLRDLGRWFSGGTPPRDAPEHWEGDIPWISAKDINSTRLREPTTFITRDAATNHSRVVPAGSILLIVRGMALAHGLPVVETTNKVAFNQDLRALVCGAGIAPRFVYYALIGNRWRLDAHIDRAAHGTARVVDSIYAERILLPSPEAQREIADYLDRECARIDELMATADGLISGLEEHRTDAVRQAVAGLHHGPLKFGYTVTDCKHRTPDYLESGFPVISTREVQRGALDLSSVDRFVSGEDYADLREGGRDPRVGDIVYSRNASLGVAAYVRDLVDICMGQDVVLISRRPQTSELLAHMLNYAVADQVEQLSVGSTFSRINVPVIRSLVVPYDTPDREAAALDSIREAFGRLGELEVAIKALVRRLREYRDALITEAVTDKLPIAA